MVPASKSKQQQVSNGSLHVTHHPRTLLVEARLLTACRSAKCPCPHAGAGAAVCRVDPAGTAAGWQFMFRCSGCMLTQVPAWQKSEVLIHASNVSALLGKFCASEGCWASGRVTSWLTLVACDALHVKRKGQACMHAAAHKQQASTNSTGQSCGLP